MNEFLKTLTEQIKEFFKKLNRGQWIRLGILVAVLIAIAVTAGIMLGRVEYSVLYSGLDPAEAGEVFTLLQNQGVQVKTEGTQVVSISVPKSQEQALRMQLAAQGYPKSGPDYGLFANASGFGATDSEKQQWKIYQLEANLRSAICSMDKISNAVVFLNIPQDSVFVLDANKKSATAAISVEVEGGKMLTNEQVRAIVNLVSKSAPGLDPENVSVTDFNMNVYELVDEADLPLTPSNYAANQMDIQTRVREDLEKQLMNLLTPVFGPSKIRVAVNVILNFDKSSIESVKFEPPVPEAGNNGIVVSMRELSEILRAGEEPAGAVGTDPNGIAPEYPTTADNNNPYEKVEREMNMEVNETRETIDKAQATIEKLSVSVLVDSQADVQEQVRNLVSNAIGVELKNVSVENMAFAERDDSLTDALNAQSDMARTLLLSKMLPIVVIVVAVLVIVAMILKLIRDAMRKPEVINAIEHEDVYDIDDARERLDLLVGEQEEPIPDIDLNKKSRNREQVERLIEKDPAAVAQLLRNWLTEDKYS